MTRAAWVWTPIDFERSLDDQINRRVDEVKEAIASGWPAQDIWAMFGYIIFSLNEEFEEEVTGLYPEEIKHIYKIVHRNLRNPIRNAS